MYRKKLAVFDLDNTLIDATPAFVELNNAYFGRQIKVEEYTEHWSETRWREGYSDEEWAEKQGVAWARHAIRTKFYRYLPEMPGARDVLLGVDAMGARSSILTSRRVEFREDTEYSLLRLFPETEFCEMLMTGAYDGDYVSNDSHMFTKGEMLVAMGADAFVDDQPKHVLSAAEYGIPAVLFGDCPESHGVRADESRGLYRAKTWPEADMILKRILSHS